MQLDRPDPPQSIQSEILPETTDNSETDATSASNLASRPPTPNPRLGLLLVVWLVLVVAAWFAIHRPFAIEVPYVPFSPEIPLALGRTLAAVGLLGLMLLASTLLGLRLLSLFLKDAKFNEAEKTLFGVGLGLGLNGFLIFGFGLVGLLHWLMAYGLLFIELAVNWRLFLELTKTGRNWWQAGKSGKTSNWRSTTLRFYLGFVAVITLLIALAPPIAWDSQTYHLVGPKLWVEAGRIEPLSRIIHTNFPSGVEMLYTWALLLLNDSLAQIIHWSYGLLGAWAIYAFARRFFQTDNYLALLAATLYLSIPLVQVLMGWAYTDLALTFYSLMAFYAVLLAFQVDKAYLFRFVLISGIFVGLAFGGKYTAILIAPAVAAVFLLVGLQARLDWRKLFGGLVGLGLGALATMLPWLLRNLFFADNPLAPLIFGARGWDKAEIGHLSGHSGIGSINPLDILTIPFSMAVMGIQGGKHDATLNPFFLALAPLTILVIWRERKRPVLVSLALAVGVFYLFWALVAIVTTLDDQGRILLPVYPLLALLTAYALWRLPNLKLGMLRPFAGLVLGIYLAVNVINLGLSLIAYDSLPVFAGLKTRDTYLEENLGSYYRAARFVSANLPPDAYVHMFFEPRSYYLNRRAAPDNDIEQFFFYYSRYPDAASFNAILKQRGATHVLISERGERFLLQTPEYGRDAILKQAQPLLAELETKYWKQIYREEGEYSIYELK